MQKIYVNKENGQELFIREGMGYIFERNIVNSSRNGGRYGSFTKQELSEDFYPEWISTHEFEYWLNREDGDPVPEFKEVLEIRPVMGSMCKSNGCDWCKCPSTTNCRLRIATETSRYVISDPSALLRTDLAVFCKDEDGADTDGDTLLCCTDARIVARGILDILADDQAINMVIAMGNCEPLHNHDTNTIEKDGVAIYIKYNDVETPDVVFNFWANHQVSHWHLGVNEQTAEKINKLLGC